MFSQVRVCAILHVPHIFYKISFLAFFAVKDFPPHGRYGMANSVDPDQTADLGLRCLFMPICPKTYSFTVSYVVEVSSKN